MNTEIDRTELTEQFLSLIPLKEESYKSDIELLERYHAYSAELLRLSLAGLGVIGFLVTNKLVSQPAVKIFLVIGIVLFGISSGGALAHRYFSSDGIHHLIKAARLSQRRNPEKAEIECQETQMKEMYRKSWRYLRLSCISLALGAMAIALGFVVAALI